MNNIELGAVGACTVILLLLLRVPIGVAMGVVALGGISASTGISAALGIAKAIPYDLIGDWNFSAVPMFLLMGLLASETGLTKGLFQAARIYTHRIPGGLASGTVLASALFASASGSSVATAAAFSRIAVPEMLRAGYNPGLATGCVAVAGTLGSLIPPSLIMIVFGIMMSTSIGELFMAGVVPGLLSALMFILYITVRVLLNPDLAPREDGVTFSRAQRLAALKDVWPLPAIVLGVIGGIFAGIFSATEAGAVGASMVCVIALVRRALTRKVFLEALTATVRSTSTIFIIVVGAALFQRFMSLTGLPMAASEWMTSMVSSQIGIILVICVIYIILGMFLESISIMLLTLPILAPLLQASGVDLVWFCIIVVKLLEIGLVTPPVGMNIFVIKGAVGSRVPLGTIFRGAGGFLLVDFITLGLIIAFPIISLWLPNQMLR